MSATMPTPDRIALEHAIDQDVQEHIADDVTVNAIRDGKLVAVRWNELTDDEQRMMSCFARVAGKFYLIAKDPGSLMIQGLFS